jgi:hypothetical protein
MSYRLHARFDRIGEGDPKKFKRPDRDEYDVVIDTPSEGHVARTVSDLARKVRPSLEGRAVRTRLTTPDGGPWATAAFYLHDETTGAPLGHGLVQVSDAEHGHPWHLYPYPTRETTTTTERHHR